MLMSPLLRTVFGLLVLWTGLQAAAPVVVLSFDGLAAQAFRRETMPRTWALAQQGLRGRGIPPFPCTTFNGHATLTTGCWPERHGIVANSLVDPKRGYADRSAKASLLEAEPLWIAATRSGLRAAAIGWPFGDEPWQGQSPWRQIPFHQGQTDRDTLHGCAQALEGGADLVMAYLSGIDEEGHLHGPDSLEVRQKLGHTDALLAPWLEARLKAHPGLRIWLVADHGMARVTHRISLPRILEGLPARIIAHGGTATLHLERFQDLLPAKRRLAQRGLKVWTRSELPEAFRLKGSTRSGDLFVLAPQGSWLAQHEGSPEAEKERIGRQGCHAFAPTDPAMATWLVILGTGRKGDLGSLPLWDIAPTVARQLGIRWEKAPDGKPIPGVP